MGRSRLWPNARNPVGWFVYLHPRMGSLPCWVWQKVVIVNVQTGSQTTLNLTDIQVNQGLKESLFTERMMQQGAAALR